MSTTIIILSLLYVLNTGQSLVAPQTSRASFMNEAGAVAAASSVFGGLFSTTETSNAIDSTSQDTTHDGGIAKPFRIGYSSQSVQVNVPAVAAVDSSVTIAAETAGETVIPFTIVNVPISVWYPSNNQENEETSLGKEVKYPYTISVAKIARLIARWNGIPGFLKSDYQLDPVCLANQLLDSSSPVIKVVDEGAPLSSSLPQKAPVVLLAHGYLGSRFDLSHVAEEMARYGFICISAEYPESLCASYDSPPSLDRDLITRSILSTLKEEWKVKPTSFGVVGHSLGCGTAMTAGDSTWTRVCIAGPPALRGSPSAVAMQNVENSPILCIASVNDGAVTLPRIDPLIPKNFQRFVAEEQKFVEDGSIIPRQTAVLFQDAKTAPNHISFLNEGVNDAMIKTLSPLLVLAKALKLPVLDFDKYKVSRDSVRTAKVVVPLVRNFLLQNMAK
jgi:hypothetical protein